MLGDSRLREGELNADHVRDRARGLLTVAEQLQDSPAYGVAENIKRMHKEDNITTYLYKLNLRF